MQLSEAKWVFLGFILCISDTWGTRRRVCVFQGSSVILTCSNAKPAANVIWYSTTKNDSTYHLTKLPADGNYVTHKATKDYSATLTIVEVRERDERVYCCLEKDEDANVCWNEGTELRVADVQVKVFPASEGQKLNLMCTTSCSLTDSPAAFIWYQNTEFLYEDWSPWYQDLVSSEDSVTYSCAVKGYEELRAPDVSVDSVTSACFVVTYAKGQMCSQKSVNEPCSITYPRAVSMQMIQEKGFVTLTCNTSCPAAEPHAAFRWYLDRKLVQGCESQDLTAFQLYEQITCAVKSNEELISEERCINSDCMVSNYASRRVCLLQGSSATMSIHFKNSIKKYEPFWYKITRTVEEEIDTVVMVEDESHIENFVEITMFHHFADYKYRLIINDVKKNDTGEYMFGLHMCETCKNSDLPGVMLVVTDLKVTITPSAEMPEGQKVTLTCTTSCPLTDSTVYIWYFNSQPLDLSKNQSKYLVLNPVGIQHAGNYSCAVTSPHALSSTTEALTVKLQRQSIIINNIIRLVVLLLIPLVGFTLYSMTRRKTGTVSAELKEQTEQMDPLFERVELRVNNPLTGRAREQQQEDAV